MMVSARSGTISQTIRSTTSRDSLISACISGLESSSPFSFATWAATSLMGTSLRLRLGRPLIIGARAEESLAGSFRAAAPLAAATTAAACGVAGAVPGIMKHEGMAKIGRTMNVAERGAGGTGVALGEVGGIGALAAAAAGGVTTAGFAAAASAAAAAGFAAAAGAAATP